MVATNDGGYAMLVYFGAGVSESESFLMKVNSNGDSLWAYGGDQNRFYSPKGLIGTEQGEVATTLVNGDSLFLMIFSQQEGVPRRYGYHYDCDYYYLASFWNDNNRDFFVAGTSYRTFEEYDFAVFKIRADGQLVWYRRLDSQYDDHCAGAVTGANGGLVMAGNMMYQDEADIWVVAIDADGEVVWSRTYGGVGANRCHFILKEDGGYLLYSYFSSLRTDRYGFLRISSEGDSLGFVTFTDYFNYGAGVLRLEDGSIVYAGSDEPPQGFGGYDVELSRIDSHYGLVWRAYFGGERDDNPESIVRCADGGYAILASTTSFYEERFTNSDIWLIKTTPDTTNSAPGMEAQMPERMALLAAYPNPFNGKVVVSCQLSVFSEVKLGIWDASGREVAVLARGFHPAGEYRRVWDAAGMAAGVYVARMRYGGEVVSRKLVLCR
jgi:hypothetical protein